MNKEIFDLTDTNLKRMNGMAQRIFLFLVLFCVEEQQKEKGWAIGTYIKKNRISSYSKKQFGFCFHPTWLHDTRHLNKIPTKFCFEVSFTKNGIRYLSNNNEFKTSVRNNYHYF